MDGSFIGIIFALIVILMGLYYFLHHLIKSAVKEGTLEALIEHDKIKKKD